jgi:glycosyl transferase family 25
MSELIFNQSNTFCINLDSSKDRWMRMQNRFTYFGMNVTRWNALTGPELPEDKYVCYLKQGQIGCAASHVSIWRHMIINDIDYALIMEDDACLDKKWREKLNEFTGNSFDVILLYSSEDSRPLYTWNKCVENCGAVCYIISKAGAIKILNMFSNCFYASDWMTSRLQLFGNSYSYFPWLAIQECKDTTVGSNLEGDTKKIQTLLSNVNYSIDNYPF